MAGHLVLKSMTGKQVKTNPGCDSARSSSSLTSIGLWYPDFLQALHPLYWIIPEYNKTSNIHKLFLCNKKASDDLLTRFVLGQRLESLNANSWRFVFMYERVKTAQLFLTWNSLNIIETHYFSHGPSILPFSIPMQQLFQVSVVNNPWQD